LKKKKKQNKKPQEDCTEFLSKGKEKSFGGKKQGCISNSSKTLNPRETLEADLLFSNVLASGQAGLQPTGHVGVL